MLWHEESTGVPPERIAAESGGGLASFRPCQLGCVL